MELYETANAHQYLVKLSRYCCEKRLAAVYDEEFTTVLSDVLLAGILLTSSIMLNGCLV